MNRYLFLLFPLIACGGGSTDTDEAEVADNLTCDVIEDPGFCWTTAVEEAYACFSGTDATAGTMEMDGMNCTFDDGTSVRFDSPVPEFGSEEVWAFTVLDGTGAECAKFLEVETASESGFELTVASGFYETSASMSYSVSCADGTLHETSDVFGMLDCSFDSLPGYSSSGGGDSASFTLMPAPAGSMGLFSCAAR